MSSAEVSRSLAEMLETVPHAAGVNNHQGSLVTSDGRLMADLMPQLRQRNLFFIDSRTSAATVAYRAAQTAHVPSSFRNIPFLDDVREASAAVIHASPEFLHLFKQVQDAWITLRSLRLTITEVCKLAGWLPRGALEIIHESHEHIDERRIGFPVDEGLIERWVTAVTKLRDLDADAELPAVKR